MTAAELPSTVSKGATLVEVFSSAAFHEGPTWDPATGARFAGAALSEFAPGFNSHRGFHDCLAKSPDDLINLGGREAMLGH